MAQSDPIVGILMGSKSDWATMKNAADTLEKFGIPHEAQVISAHRNADRLDDYCASAQSRGLKIIIAGAGMAAALPGVVAAKTPLPVLGVPMESKVNGLDSLLSMVQMPAGIPVGTLAIGRAGAVNAALLSAAILALNDETISEALLKFRAEQSAVTVDLSKEE
jgi:5-(carboxyamino)imidazole ribonucleotide mutase